MNQKVKNFLSDLSLQIRKGIFKLLFSTESFPIFLTLAIFGILLVLIRMKTLEQDYRYNNLRKDEKKISFENKGLRAKKARQLSVRNLRKIAEKYNLSEPSQNQIIVIP